MADFVFMPESGWLETAHQTEPLATRPLREVVDRGINPAGFEREILSCGHEQRPVEDIAGPTNAVRRRCRHCQKEGVPVVPPSFVVGVQPNIRDKVGIVHVEHVDPVVLGDGTVVDQEVAVVGRATVTKVQCLATALTDSGIVGRWRVTLSAVTWIDPETDLACGASEPAEKWAHGEGWTHAECREDWEPGLCDDGSGRVPIPDLSPGEFRKVTP